METGVYSITNTKSPLLTDVNTTNYFETNILNDLKSTLLILSTDEFLTVTIYLRFSSEHVQQL